MQRNIKVDPYSPEWPAQFEQEASRIRHALGEVVADIHHIGSTSVPGLVAKPILDILLTVHSLEALDDCDEKLRELGYDPKGEFGIPGRRYYPKGGDLNRSHHIHAFQVGDGGAGDEGIRRHLAFRDYLRSHPDEADAYSQLKIQLAKEHPHDIQAYMDGKNTMIQKLESKALNFVDYDPS